MDSKLKKTVPNQAKQHWDPIRYRQNAAFVAELGLPVLELLNPQLGERILDLGCGDGMLTMKLRDMGVSVVGVDASSEQVEAAQALGLDARVMNGENLEFVANFDAVFSNAAMHWMSDADAVIDGVWRVLRPGGRFVAEMGGAGNVAKIREALEDALDTHGYNGKAANPWYFPTVTEQRDRLEKCGFVVHDMTLIDRPTPLPGDIRDWLETFADSYILKLPKELQQIVIDDVARRLHPILLDEAGICVADYVRLRFFATRAL